jgi:hypothetical protein
MGLDTKFQEAANAVENLKFDWDIKKDVHSKTKKDKKKKDNGPPHTAVIAIGTALDRVPSTWEKAGANAIIRTQIFQLYVNLCPMKLANHGTRLSRHRPKMPLERISREKCMTRREARCGSHFSTA